MILICKRASGDLQTTATWIREFVRNHPAYAHDSVVSNEVAHDLVMEMKAIGEVGGHGDQRTDVGCRGLVPFHLF